MNPGLTEEILADDPADRDPELAGPDTYTAEEWARLREMDPP